MKVGSEEEAWNGVLGMGGRGQDALNASKDLRALYEKIGILRVTVLVAKIMGRRRWLEGWRAEGRGGCSRRWNGGNKSPG